jgi:hypothetical protein
LRELGAAVRHGVRGGTQAVFCFDCMLLLALHTGLVEYSKVLCFETERKLWRGVSARVWLSLGELVSLA